MNEAHEIAKASIAKHEGLRLDLYQDTVGKLSVGYGHNIEDRGISKAVADLILAEDMETAIRDTHIVYGEGFELLTPNRQAVLIEMCYQLGRSKFADFRNLLMNARRGDHEMAANEMLDSQWRDQVPARAEELADIYRTG